MEGRKAVVFFTDGVDTASQLATDRSTLARVEESGVLVYPIQYDTEDRFAGHYGGRQPPPIFMPPRFPRGGRRRWLFEPQANNQFPSRGRPDYGRAAQYLRDLADHSGARLFKAESIGNAEKAFSQIAEELRHQYALSYYPANSARDGSYRQIRVRVDQPNLVAHARKGYRAKSQDRSSNNQLTKKGEQHPGSDPDRP